MFEEKRFPKEKRTEEGCKIKVQRDNTGRIRGISTNGKCSKSELSMFHESNLNHSEEESEDD